MGWGSSIVKEFKRGGSKAAKGIKTGGKSLIEYHERGGKALLTGGLSEKDNIERIGEDILKLHKEGYEGLFTGGLGVDGVKDLLGGKEEKKEKASEHESALADISRGQFKRYESVYKPQLRTLEDMADVDKSSTLRGRSNADAMQTLTAGTPSVAPNGAVRSLADGGTRVLASGQSEADNQADDRQTEIRKAAVAQGTGNATTGVSGLGDAGQVAANRMQSELESWNRKRQRRHNTLQSLGGAGMAYGIDQGWFGGDEAATPAYSSNHPTANVGIG